MRNRYRPALCSSHSPCSNHRLPPTAMAPNHLRWSRPARRWAGCSSRCSACPRRSPPRTRRDNTAPPCLVCVSTAIVAKAPPLPCVASTSPSLLKIVPFKTVPFKAVPFFETAPFPCGLQVPVSCGSFNSCKVSRSCPPPVPSGGIQETIPARRAHAAFSAAL